MKPKEMAADTLRILDEGQYENQQGHIISLEEQIKSSVANTKLYTPDNLSELVATVETTDRFDTNVEVRNETTFDALRRLYAEREEQIMCLNFASAKNPGGGFLGGAVAQEECLARASALYPTLLEGKEYYTFNRALETCLYSDYMIYSPDVPVFRLENGALMDDAVPVSIVTSPAVNAGVVKRNEPGNIELIEPAMYQRTEKLLALCLHYKHEVLILGAWGCGVFQNDPEMIAKIFEDLLTNKFKGCFGKVVFAVKTKSEEMLRSFSSRFLREVL